MITPPQRNLIHVRTNDKCNINRLLSQPLLFFLCIFISSIVGITISANAAVNSLTLHKSAFDNMPGGTINIDFVPDLSKAQINLAGTFKYLETNKTYEIITETGNTNGKTITDNGSANVRWNNVGTDSNGKNVDVILHLANFTHSGNSTRTCVLRYDKQDKTLWNGANVDNDTECCIY